MDRNVGSSDRRSVAWLAASTVAGFFAQSRVITVHEDHVVRLVENNSPPAALLASVFLLLGVGFAFLVFPALRCYWTPGRSTAWSRYRITLGSLTTALWAALPLTWAAETIAPDAKTFTTIQTVISREPASKRGNRLIITSWRGLPRETLSTPGRALDGFDAGDLVEIRLVTNKAGTLNVTGVENAGSAKEQPDATGLDWTGLNLTELNRVDMGEVAA